jgi:hypothetical protein
MPLQPFRMRSCSSLYAGPVLQRGSVCWHIGFTILLLQSCCTTLRIYSTVVVIKRAFSTCCGADSSGLDPVMILREQNPVVAPLIEGFSFLAIATSFIGFVLGLSDFFMDALGLPPRKRYIAYALTILPPYAFALAFPDVFFSALDLVSSPLHHDSDPSNA